MFEVDDDDSDDGSEDSGDQEDRDYLATNRRIGIRVDLLRRHHDRR